MSKQVKLLGTKLTEKRQQFEGEKIILGPNASLKDKAKAFIHNNVRFMKQSVVLLVIIAIISLSIALVFIAPYIFPVLFIWIIYRLIMSSSFNMTKK